ncbi:hypothetical protein C8R46DRAFT_1352893 [Mycena filopes]|nr:hypothetical protein C8R46DRAFT_1352893 [Mycena filopes]
MSFATPPSTPAPSQPRPNTSLEAQFSVGIFDELYPPPSQLGTPAARRSRAKFQWPTTVTQEDRLSVAFRCMQRAGFDSIGEYFAAVLDDGNTSTTQFTCCHRLRKEAELLLELSFGFTRERRRGEPAERFSWAEILTWSMTQNQEAIATNAPVTFACLTSFAVSDRAEKQLDCAAAAETPSQAPTTEAPSQAPVTETPLQAPTTEPPSQAPTTDPTTEPLEESDSDAAETDDDDEPVYLGSVQFLINVRKISRETSAIIPNLDTPEPNTDALCGSSSSWPSTPFWPILQPQIEVPRQLAASKPDDGAAEAEQWADSLLVHLESPEAVTAPAAPMSVLSPGTFKLRVGLTGEGDHGILRELDISPARSFPRTPDRGASSSVSIPSFALETPAGVKIGVMNASEEMTWSPERRPLGDVMNRSSPGGTVTADSDSSSGSMSF